MSNGTHLVILGGGPAGNSAATWAARFGARVTLVEREIVGGAAHLLDCIPSKAMIATGGAMSATKRFAGMGIEQHDVEIDVDSIAERISGIVGRIQSTTTELLESQGVTILHGEARFVSDREVVVTSSTGEERIEGDAFLIATGSRPRIPAWCSPDGERILTTRDCYPPKVFPKSIVVVGSGVTGVEFVHMFS
ncbi:MAG: FAD-dependent oxidoreductase, partial [Actinomycetota bacterium]